MLRYCDIVLIYGSLIKLYDLFDIILLAGNAGNYYQMEKRMLMDMFVCMSVQERK